MVEIADIKDRESLEAWLWNRPYDDAVFIASRLAARVLPEAWKRTLYTNFEDVNKIPLLAASFLSWLPYLSREVDYAKSALAIGAILADLLDHFGDPLLPAYDSAIASYDALNAISQPREAPMSAAQNFDAIDATANYFDITFLTQSDRLEDRPGASGSASDAANLPPLWYDQPNPLQAEWEEVRARLEGDENWAFWLDWYQRLLDGGPFPPDYLALLETIALKDDAFWDRDDDEVNADIADLVLEMALEATPYGEEIIVNDEGLFEAIERQDAPAKTVEDGRDRIRDVIEDLTRASNQHPELWEEAQLLEKQLDRYPDNALRLHEACTKVVWHLNLYETNGDLPANVIAVADARADLLNTADDF